MIIISKYLVPKGYIGITLFPFIILKNKGYNKNSILIHHEKIHLQQQLELGILIFYVWYSLEFTIRLFQYKNWHTAYQNISFEREAYANEHALRYIKKRPKWAFINFMTE